MGNAQRGSCESWSHVVFSLTGGGRSLETLEDRRDGGAKAGKRGIFESLVLVELSGLAVGVEHADDAVFRKDDPDGFAAVGEIKVDLFFKMHRRFRRHDLDGDFWRALN